MVILHGPTKEPSKPSQDFRPEHQRRSHLGRFSALDATISPAWCPVVPAEEYSWAAQFATQTPDEGLTLPEALDLPRGLPFAERERARATGEAIASLKHVTQASKHQKADRRLEANTDHQSSERYKSLVAVASDPARRAKQKNPAKAEKTDDEIQTDLPIGEPKMKHSGTSSPQCTIRLLVRAGPNAFERKSCRQISVPCVWT